MFAVLWKRGFWDDGLNFQAHWRVEMRTIDILCTLPSCVASQRQQW